MTATKRQLATLLGPWMVGVSVLTIGPMFASAIMSCLSIDGLSTSEWRWVGAEHYARALGVDRGATPDDGDPWYFRLIGGRPNDPMLARALHNSLSFSVLAVPLSLAASLGVALFLNRPARGMSLVRAAVYLPHVLGGVATIVIWSWLFNPQFGYVNLVIRFLFDLLNPVVALFNETGTAHWKTPGWLYDPNWCKPAVVILHMWTMGGSMLVFLAALRRVPTQRLQAATLDGAGALGRFLHVTLPSIAPAGLFNLILTTVFAMQSFSEAYLLQNRAQQDGLLFYVLYVYRIAFEPPYQLGYASALAWILFGVLALIVLPIFRLSRSWVYDAVDDLAA